MSNIIFYFSGTGNSLAVASSVAEKLTETEIVSILALRENKKISSVYERVGFVFPCSYAHPPKIVMKLIKDLQLNENQKIFIIVTYGGKYGFALSDMKKQMQSYTKYGIQGFSIQMPGNHIVGYSAYSKSKQRNIFRKAQKNIDKIVDQIQQDVPTIIKDSNRIKKSVMNYAVKVVNKILGIKDIFQTQTEFFTTDACVHCGICERICPVENIKVSSTDVKFKNHCEQCMACIQWCPLRAISHPNIPLNRRYYRHPDIKIEDMIQKPNRVIINDERL